MVWQVIFYITAALIILHVWLAWTHWQLGANRWQNGECCLRMHVFIFCYRKKFDIGTVNKLRHPKTFKSFTVKTEWFREALLFHRLTRTAYLYSGCLPCYKCMLNHWLQWNKWVLTNFDHDRQWFNTLIPPSHESAAVTVDCMSLLGGPVRLILGYTTVDIHCSDRRYEWDGGITFEHVGNKLNLKTLHTTVTTAI